MSARAIGRLLERRPTVAIVGALALVFAVGWIDHETGDRLSFALFYLAPVSAVAWVSGLRGGILISFFAAATSLFGDSLGMGSVGGVALWNAGVRLGVLLVVARITSRLRESLDTERRQANTDALTGVLNPRAFDTIAERELTRALRYGRPLTLAYVDLDHFKQVNDSLGHSVGDRLLRTVATELADRVRPADVVARMGGDEFTVLMPETTVDEATVAFNRIRAQLLERMQLYGWPVTFSVGLSTCTGAGTTVDAMLADADRLMYEQKRIRRSSGEGQAQPSPTFV